MLKECKFTRVLVIAGIIEKLSVLPMEGTYSSLMLKINHSGLCAIALFNFLLRWQFSSKWIIGKSPFNLYTALHRCGWEDLHQLLICGRTLSTWRDTSLSGREEKEGAQSRTSKAPRWYKAMWLLPCGRPCSCFSGTWDGAVSMLLLNSTYEH